MKKFAFVLSMFLTLSISISASETTDIKDVLKGLGGNSSSSSSTTDVIGSVLNGVLSSSKISVSDVIGTWKYADPAVEFKSDNLLKKAGGSVASSTITSKIKTYYEKVGMKNLVVTIKDDNSFTMSIGKVNLSGTISNGESDGQFFFNFKTVASISLGKITAYMSKNISGQLTLTFDASKLISIVSSISKLANNSTVSSVSSLLSSYDGLTVGFLLTKQ